MHQHHLLAPRSVRPGRGCASNAGELQAALAAGGDDAGVEAGQVQPAVEAGVLDLQAAVHARRSSPAAWAMRRRLVGASPSWNQNVATPPTATTSSATAGRSSARRNTSTRSGGAGQVGQRRVHRPAEDLAALRVDEPHVSKSAARRQQVGGDEVAGPARVGRHADDGDRRACAAGSRGARRPTVAATTLSRHASVAFVAAASAWSRSQQDVVGVLDADRDAHEVGPARRRRRARRRRAAGGSCSPGG